MLTGPSGDSNYALAFNHDETMLAVASQIGTSLWDVKKKEQLWVGGFRDSRVAAFNRDGKIVVNGYDDSSMNYAWLSFYDTATREHLFTGKYPWYMVSIRDFRSVDFSLDSSMVAVAFKGGGIEVWLVDHTRLLAELSTAQITGLLAAIQTDSIKGDLYDELIERMPCLKDNVSIKIERDQEPDPA
jgi:hypothetical protein